MAAYQITFTAESSNVFSGNKKKTLSRIWNPSNSNVKLSDLILMVEFELTEARWEEDNSIIDKLTKFLLGMNTPTRVKLCINYSSGDVLVFVYIFFNLVP